MELRKFISTTISKFLNEQQPGENSVELFKNIAINGLQGKIDGRFLNKKQAEELQREIESNYTQPGVVKFGADNTDIRTNMFNYDNPIAEKTINGVNLRIAEGLIRDKRKTYLLYADGKIIGEFYSVQDIKRIVKYIEDNLVTTSPKLQN